MSLPIAYTIHHEGLRLDIALVETSRLLIHEEIIPDRLLKLEQVIQNDGVQSAPILVDRQSLVVLDGMHRIKVMQKLGCRFTCVCLLDYFDPSIRVQRWCRVISSPFDEEKARKVFSSLGMTLIPCETNIDPDEETGLLLRFKEKTFKIKSSDEDLVQDFRRSYQLETMLQSWGYEIKHCTEQDVDNHLKNPSCGAVIYLPKVKKEQVIQIALNQDVFSPKATRHRLPARPVQVNVPLSLLRNTELSIMEANYKLGSMLRKRKLKRYLPGKIWMDRIYDEVLYVFM